jgi:hypothetical protein
MNLLYVMDHCGDRDLRFVTVIDNRWFCMGAMRKLHMDTRKNVVSILRIVARRCGVQMVEKQNLRRYIA